MTPGSTDPVILAVDGLRADVRDMRADLSGRIENLVTRREHEAEIRRVDAEAKLTRERLEVHDAALAAIRAAVDAGDDAILARIDRDEKDRAADARAARRFATTTTIAAVGVTAGAVGAIVTIFGG